MEGFHRADNDHPLRLSQSTSQSQPELTSAQTNSQNQTQSRKSASNDNIHRERTSKSVASSFDGFTFNESEYNECQDDKDKNINNNNRYRTPTRLSDTDTHSLIKRAARSALLDEVTPTGSTIFSSGDPSDDEDEDYSHKGSGVPSKSASASGGKPMPSMQSLENPSMPAIPDEQDRKRFVGCLAAVLSSMYDYESYELLSKEKKKINKNSNSDSNNHGRNENYNNNDMDNDNDVSVFFDFYESDDEDQDDFFLPLTSKSKSNDNNDEYNHNNGQKDDDSKSNNDSFDTGEDESTPLLLSPAPSADTTDNFYSRRCQSFESLGSSTTSAMSSAMNANGNSNGNGNGSQHMPKRAMPPASKLKPMSSFRRQMANAQQMKNNKNDSNTNTGDTKAKLSRQRYLTRRYELYSGLLLSSSELLLLDKSIARAFLPMLSRVLVPQIHKTQSQQEELKNTKQKQSTGATRPQEAQRVHLLDNVDELSPFLDSLTPGAGFRCVSLLLLQYLLNSEQGYDSRIRHALKKMSILVLQRDMDEEPVERNLFRNRNNTNRNKNRNKSQSQGQRQGQGQGRQSDRKTSGAGYTDDDSTEDLYEQRTLLLATRKFEALEQNIARRLILLSSPARSRKSKPNTNEDSSGKTNSNGKARMVNITREQLVRGVKIGGAGILAGTLFAVTGGLAAPGIAAGVAAFSGAVAGTAAVTALTSGVVVTTIFGVGGGGIAAYKMQRRTQGVTEFEFCRETKGRPDRRSSPNPEYGSGNNEDNIEAELFSILCISGWLRDRCDYQRPWGLQPTHPRITDRLEMLERFYSVYSPDHLPKCERILSSWKGEEEELWKILREKYGRDPDHLFPLDCANHSEDDIIKGQGALTLDQEEILAKLFIELGYHSVAPEQEQAMHHQHENMSPFEKMRNGWKNRRFIRNPGLMEIGNDDKWDSTHGPSTNQQPATIQNKSIVAGGGMLHSYDSESSGEPGSHQQDEGNAYKPPDHLSTVWDWKTTYGGEMYTVKWESKLLTQICDCVVDLAVDVVSGATRQILKQTILATLLSAVIWPTYLLNLAHMIDGDWTIAVERADEAGVVLAKTLLYSRAGRRPVTLVGYSFGARIIYSCLKELARYQEEWEQYQELLEESSTSSNGGSCQDHRRLSKYKQKMKGMREPASIVEDAIFLGLPNHLSLSSWTACRQIVAGRLVNCYSNNDLILSLMFQAKRFSGGSFNNGTFSILKPVCGTCPVEEPGIENIDCSDLILGHQDYCLQTGKILERIGFGEPIKHIGEAKLNGAVAVLSNERS